MPKDRMPPWIQLILLLVLVEVRGFINISTSTSKWCSQSIVTPSNNIRRIPEIRKEHDLARKYKNIHVFPQKETRLVSALSLGVAGVSSSSNYLVRIVFLRAMAFVHLVAFWVAFRQNKALIGDRGLSPARHALDQAQARGASKRSTRLKWRHEQQQQQKQSINNKLANKSARRHFASQIKADTALWNILARSSIIRKMLQWVDSTPSLLNLREVLWDRCDRSDRPLPTLLWLAKDRKRLNPWLDGVAVTGLTLSSSILIMGSANLPMVLGLWLCQRSLMSVGSVWYGYGWEPQLAELSFHAMFMVPLLSVKSIPSFPIPSLVQWMIKWHLFRIMMGAGLIKLRSGDKKWKDLTTMFYFYETQPVPNPLTRYFHWMPKFWHKGEVLINHFVELIAPWVLIIPGLPGPWRRAGGLIQMVFQSMIISSGNLSFLNWLTMVPAIACLDDGFLARFFGPPTYQAAANAHTTLSLPRTIVSTLFFVGMAQLSVPVIRNLCSKNQIMNGSFDPLRLVNTYGAFGTVEEVREEFIIKASADLEEWIEYEFKVKPGRVDRSPRFLSPYHYRLDWQMWIAACLRRVDRSPWIYVLLLKLLEQDQDVLRLLDKEPFKSSAVSPKYIRIEKYAYHFHNRAKERESNPPYWDRKLVGRVYPRQGIATIDSLKQEIRALQPWLLE